MRDLVASAACALKGIDLKSYLFGYDALGCAAGYIAYFVAFALQVSAHIVECHSDEPRNVFANDPAGLTLSYNSKHLRPEVTVIL